MKTPTEYLDEMSDESLSVRLTIEQWLDWLLSLRDELDMRISSTMADFENEKERKSKQSE